MCTFPVGIDTIFKLYVTACVLFVQEVRTALPVWTLSHTNGLTQDESHYGESGTSVDLGLLS